MKCGECTECCELLKIDSTKPLEENVIEQVTINSPAGELCNQCEKNIGCKIHEMRPLICRTFECMYTQHEDAPIELRPDNSGVIFEKLDNDMIVGSIRPGRSLPHIAMEQVKSFNEQGYSVVLTKYDTNHVKTFCSEGKEQREILLRFAQYRRVADGEYTNN